MVIDILDLIGHIRENSMKNINALIDQALDDVKRKKIENEWYNLRPILGHAN